MNQSLRNNTRLASHALLLAAGCALSAFVLSGCDQRSPTSVAVHKSSTDVQVLSGNGGAAPETSDHVKTLTQVASDTQKVAKEGSEGEQAAANLLLAAAQHGLAEQPMDKAVSLDLGARNTITRIGAFASEWSASSGSAAAAEGFDPSAQITELGKLRERKQSEIATLQTELNKVQGQVEALRAAAKSKLDAAAAKHGTYTQMTSDAVRLSAGEAAKVVAEANVLRREGDALRLEGSKIEAEADSIAPTIGELRAKIDEYANQSHDFEAAQNDLKARAATFRAQAEAARTAATVAANQLDALVGDLEKLFDGELKQAYDDAIAGYSKARGSASSAQNTSPGFGKLSAAEAMAFAADAQWAKSQSFGNLASTLENLARVTPTLPQAAKYTESAGKYRQVQTEALKEASSAYKSAAAAFGSARVSGPSKERLEKLGALIEKAKTATSDSTSDVAAAFGIAKRVQERKKEAAPEESKPESGAEIAVDPELLTAVGAFIEATAKGESRPDLVHGPEALVKMVEASSNLDRKLRDKFNSSFAEAMGPMGQGSLNPKMFETLKAEDAKITMKSADSAIVAFEGAPAMPFKKVDGGWKMDVAAMIGPQAAMVVPMAGALTTIFNDVAKEVEEGKYPDASAVGAAIQQKMMAMMGPK